MSQKKTGSAISSGFKEVLKIYNIELSYLVAICKLLTVELMQIQFL